ncbi:hypothetical protein Ancab_025701 [Ancistrocladus abbreviatus]
MRRSGTSRAFTCHQNAAKSSARAIMWCRPWERILKFAAIILPSEPLPVLQTTPPKQLPELASYGKNERNQSINFTAPVLTQVIPDNKPFSKLPLFVASFYVPKADQADPPPAEGVESQVWEDKSVATKQFGGFVSDYDFGKDAAALEASVPGSEWCSSRVESGRSSLGYIVAQYNSPFQTQKRVNEIWLTIN